MTQFHPIPSSPKHTTPPHPIQMETPPDKLPSNTTKITHVDDDLLHNILAKLPAQTFASAACVNRNWNTICSRILSRPILSSALSLNPHLPEAVEEVTRKVLGGPIRPHFAILVCAKVYLDDAHRLIMAKMGSTIPVITCDAFGVMGRDVVSGEFQEVNYTPNDADTIHDPVNVLGISLTVGYLPGLKVAVIPLLNPEEGSSVDEFVMDIKNYSTSASGCTDPEAVFMFGDSQADMNPVLEKMDYALSKRTVIAGNESCNFRYSGMASSRFSIESIRERRLYHGAVALVFAMDRTTSDGPGKIDFHFAVGAGVTAVGPTYRVVSAKMRTCESTTWLTAKREGENETLDGQQLLDDFDTEMGDPVANVELYIKVTKRRKFSIGSEKFKSVTVSYHPVQDGDEQYLYVHGLDIKTGDIFRFHVPDPRLASRLCANVTENFGGLRDKEIIGGFVFACCGRGSTFFGKPNMDSSPILDNFPGIPFVGMFCGGEIGRGPSSVAQSDAEEDQGALSCLHVYSSVYILMSCSSALV